MAAARSTNPSSKWCFVLVSHFLFKIACEDNLELEEHPEKNFFNSLHLRNDYLLSGKSQSPQTG